MELWLIQTELPASAQAGLERLLDDTESGRVRALGLPASRGRYIAAHAAVRLIIGSRLGMRPDQVRWRYGRHGKPELAAAPAMHVSLASSGGFALLALSHGRAVGVDLEQLPVSAGEAEATVGALEAARFFPPAEAAFVAGPGAQAARFLRLWTRKEACVKLAGGRAAQGMRLPVGTGPGPSIVRGAGGDRCDPCLVQDLPVGTGYVAAVAVAGTAPFQVRRQRFQFRS